MALSRKDLFDLEQRYGVTRTPSGTFETTRRVYQAADVERAFRRGERGMMDLKQLGTLKPGAVDRP